jgi:hypothetical protein
MQLKRVEELHKQSKSFIPSVFVKKSDSLSSQQGYDVL